MVKFYIPCRYNNDHGLSSPDHGLSSPARAACPPFYYYKKARCMRRMYRRLKLQLPKPCVFIWFPTGETVLQNRICSECTRMYPNVPRMYLRMYLLGLLLVETLFSVADPGAAPCCKINDGQSLPSCTLMCNQGCRWSVGCVPRVSLRVYVHSVCCYTVMPFVCARAATEGIHERSRSP